MRTARLNLSLVGALLVLAAAASGQAQQWETILPNSQWPAGDLFARTGAAGGRALLFSTPGLPLEVYMSTIDCDNGPTLWRLSPDQAGFSLALAPEALDAEPAGVWPGFNTAGQWL